MFFILEPQNTLQKLQTILQRNYPTQNKKQSKKIRPMTYRTNENIPPNLIPNLDFFKVQN